MSALKNLQLFSNQLRYASQPQLACARKSRTIQFKQPAGTCSSSLRCPHAKLCHICSHSSTGVPPALRRVPTALYNSAQFHADGCFSFLFFYSGECTNCAI